MLRLAIVLLLILISAVCANLDLQLVPSLIFLVLCFLFCWRYKHSTLLLLLGIFISVSPFEIIATKFLDLDFYYLLVPENVGRVMFLQSVALAPTLCFSGGHGKRLVVPEIFSDRPLFFFLFAFVVALISWGVRGAVVVGGGGGYETYRENIKEGSGLIEYLLLLFVLMGVFRRDLVMNFLLIAAIVIYAVKCALLGFRVQAVMSILVLLSLFFGNLKPSRTVLIAFVGGLFALILGVMKHSGEISAAGLVLNQNYIQTPHGGALTSSTLILNLPRLEWWQKAGVPLAFIVPRGLVGDLIPWAYPGSFVQSFENTPGGVLFGVYGNHFGGLVGAVLVGFTFVFMLLGTEKSNLQGILPRTWAAMSIAFLIFFPRWVLYDFGNYGIRMAFTFCGMLFLLLFVNAAAQSLRMRIIR